MSRLIDADAIPYADLNSDMPQSKVRVWVAFKDKIDSMPTIEPDTRPVKTIHKRVVVSKSAASNESFLRDIDLSVAHEIGEKLLESGGIKRDVYDQSEMDFLTGDCLKTESTDEGDLTIVYTVRVVGMEEESR